MIAANPEAGQNAPSGFVISNLVMIRFANLLIAWGVLVASVLRAGDAPAANTYVTDVTGIVCQECKAKVTYAVKKLPGVKDVAFAKGEKPGEQKITFASSAAALQVKDLVEALGSAAAEFQVLSLDKVKP
jgi:copper chaperone CopZ